MLISLVIVTLIITLFISYGVYATKENKQVAKSKSSIKRFLDFLK